MAASHRIEHDSMGPVEVPADRLYGAQTARSLVHFRISGERMPIPLIRAIAVVKKACALVNAELGELPADIARAIAEAADEVVAGAHDGEFPLVVWQTGSGTQTNMNVNEVLANRASELLGGVRGDERKVHPNDHVNKGQSSNDVFPSAMAIAASEALARRVVPAVRTLHDTLAAKAALSRRSPPRSRRSRTTSAGSPRGRAPGSVKSSFPRTNPAARSCPGR